MRKENKVHFKWDWQLSSSPEELWHLVSDTNRLFKNIKLPSVQPADISYEVKKEHLQLSYDSIKYSDAWIEEPYEWEFPYRLGVNRNYRNGPYKEVKLQIDLFPNSAGTKLQYQVWIKPGNALLSYFGILKLKMLVRGRLKKYFKTCDELCRKNWLPYNQEVEKKLQTGSSKRLKTIGNNLIRQTGKADIVAELIDFIQRADEIDLQHIKPLKLARQWHAKPADVLRVFLHSVKEGLLNFNWNLNCPSCRKVQKICKTLSEIHEPIYCSGCNEEFNVNFNRSVQLTFKPNPLIRKISGKSYALSDPQKSPHIVIQQYLNPGERRYVKTQLQNGVYHLKASNAEGEAILYVSKEGQNTIKVRLTEMGIDGEAQIVNQPNLILENSTQEEQLFTIEKAAWDPEEVTAAHVTSLQIFRDLFSHEVLRKGEKIAVDQLTLMFTDLFNSTGMYHEEGDDHAVGRVIEHFDILQQAVAKEEGAIVKTIGDSVMAVFSNPAHAFRAFANAQSIISKDKRFDKSLKLKAGIHHGSCVAVNLNSKIDYFGSTVNMASRLVDYADENEVVVSEVVSSNIDMQKILSDQRFRYATKKDYVQLKGFDSERFVVEHIRMEAPALRLVI
jgi:class 3 adenylate cyclase